MNSILIVEDDFAQQKYLIESAQSCNPSIQIHSTGRKADAMRIAEEYKIEAFFIDIQLVDGNGIDLAKELRSITRYQFTPIVFITGVPTKEMEAFHGVHCYDYILKPYSNVEIETVMRKILVDYLQQSNVEVKYITLEFKGVKQRVGIKDILMIERKNRKIYVKTKFEDIEYKHMNIVQFLDELPRNFIQIHQSIIVNEDYIQKIDMASSFLTLKDLDEALPIGVSFRKKVGERINGIL